jgi:hypothetical protein
MDAALAQDGEKGVEIYPCAWIDPEYQWQILGFDVAAHCGREIRE